MSDQPSTPPPVRPAQGRHRHRAPRTRRLPALIVAACVLALGAFVAGTQAIDLSSGGHPALAPTFTSVPLPPLRALAARRGVITGAGINARLLADPAYAHLVTSTFTSMTEKNAFKWMFTEPSPGVFDFRQTDRLVAYAHAHGMRIRGHTLVWHREDPGWLLNTPWTRAGLRQVLRRHVMTVVRHFRGRVVEWDVVNEPITSRALRHDVFSDVLGPHYIADAFRWAHAADPSARLILNDYANDRPGPHFRAEYRLVRGLLARHVPVDGVGLQMHHTLANPPSAYGLLAVIRKFAALGLSVEITELDIGVPLPPTAEDLARQALLYRQIAYVCASQPACTGLTFWGGDDADPNRGFPAEVGDGTLFDAAGRPKPAYNGVQQGFARATRRP